MGPVPQFTTILVLCTIFATPACRYTKVIASEDSGTASDGTDTGPEDSGVSSDDADAGPEDSDTSSDDADAGPDDSDSDTDSELECGVPTYFQWTSTSALIYPSEGILSIKEPSVLYYDESWHIYATTRPYPDWDMTYLSVTDWSEAGEAQQTSASDNSALDAYNISPQLFYFEPDGMWYLIYQVPEPAYSTGSDPGDVDSWSSSTQFMEMPDIIENSDYGGIDYWIICDETDCYLFFTALNGVLYRARTPKDSFPEGFEGTTEIVMEDDKFALFQGCNVYKMAGTDKYILIVSAIGGVGRYLRAWTSDRLDGSWTALADTEEEAFASINNVTGADWALDGINAGEMLRANPDETMTIDTCNMQFLYHGLIQEGEDNGRNEYALGLLTDAR